MSNKTAIVRASSFNRMTGERTGAARDEELNLKENKLFIGLSSVLDIKRAYESFWNDLNSNSTDVVFVESVTLQ